ncbi:hypothetical protein BN1723_011557 [Verticillium longisporum]|uniref:Right handed beta helix domain-containing protein n=1 Tax=Verticillium longisporum TaxID=100787 RepID=A0A0G4L8N8_VERLO|nr:hypothetical protein BN1723_011557 [Verticillium longisporum]
MPEHRKVSSVDKAVRDVRVEGFEVRDFQGLNIAIVGAKNTEVKHNTVVDGTAYGILTVGSVATRITGNKVSSSSLLFIGICMDDKSDVAVTKNTISDYGIGLCVQTNGARVSHNTVRNCCAGAFVDPGIDGARVTDNRISDSNPFCPSAGGVSIAGATNTKVSGNKISGITDNGNPELISSGIAIFDFLGRVASNNVVVNNTNGARVSHNTVRNCCAGAFVDPGIDGARVTDNRISDSNPFCPSAGGISIAGATNTKVSGNKISGITDNGNPELISSGIAIFDFLGRVASNNVVVNNVLKKNDQDLLVDTTGTNNKVANNDCATPEALCKKASTVGSKIPVSSLTIAKTLCDGQKSVLIHRDEGNAEVL